MTIQIASPSHQQNPTPNLLIKLQLGSIGNHSWTGWFLSWSLNIVFSSNTPVIISILGVPDFWLDRLILRIFIFPKEILTFWYVHRFIDFVYISYLLYFHWKTTHFATLTDSLFWTIFHFCYTSLLIFKILMPIFENLNISKDQWQNWAPAYQPVSQPASQPASLGKPRQA